MGAWIERVEGVLCCSGSDLRTWTPYTSFFSRILESSLDLLNVSGRGREKSLHIPLFMIQTGYGIHHICPHTWQELIQMTVPNVK